MNTERTLRIDSFSLDDTQRIGEQLGRRLKGGEVFELASDLGGGKTTLARGIAKGAGYAGAVRSPSFTIENQYQAPQLLIHHFDFYRLQEGGIVSEELEEALTEQDGVVIVEWSDIVHDILPEERVKIQINVTGETTREMLIEMTGKYGYLAEGLS